MRLTSAWACWASHYKGKHPIQYIRDFVEWKFPEGKIIETVVGAVPVSGMLPKLSTGGLVLIGDAGHVSDPITGGGIINAMASGRIAGNVIAECHQGRRRIGESAGEVR